MIQVGAVVANTMLGLAVTACVTLEQVNYEWSARPHLAVERVVLGGVVVVCAVVDHVEWGCVVQARG